MSWWMLIERRRSIQFLTLFAVMNYDGAHVHVNGTLIHVWSNHVRVFTLGDGTRHKDMLPHGVGMSYVSTVRCSLRRLLFDFIQTNAGHLCMIMINGLSC